MIKNAKVIEGQFSLFSMLECGVSDTSTSGSISSNVVELKSAGYKSVVIQQNSEDGNLIPISVSQNSKDVMINDNVEDYFNISLSINSEFFTLDVFKNTNSLPYIDSESIESLSDVFKSIVDKYINCCDRIIQRVSGSLLVEIEDKTLYFNSEGKKEMELKPNLSLFPADILLVVNKDKEVNQKQIDVLNELDITSCIKRVGDANIILEKEHTIVVNPNGWVLDYEQKPIYYKSMTYTLNPIFEDIDVNTISCEVNEQTNKEANEETSNEETSNEVSEEVDDAVKFNIGDKVQAVYGEELINGEVYSIYNNNETINIKWNNCISAFYFKLVNKQK